MTFQRNIITDYKKYEEPSKIYLGDNRVVKAYGEGKVNLECNDGADNITLNLHKILFVPEIKKNLLSVPAMTQMEAEVIFDDEKCYIIKNGKTINIGHLLKSKLYVVNTQPDYVNITTTKVPTLREWHCRYGHLNFGYINKLAQGNLVTGMKYTKGETSQECEACTRAKMHQIPVPKQSSNRTTQLLELIHSDVCGPMNTDSIGGSKYILTFTDDYTRYVTVYFLKNKSEVYEKFQEYVSMVENFTGLKVKTLRTDNGGEYVSNDFSKYCVNKGIVHQYSNPYTPQQNGVSERLNRTLMESAKSMIFHANMPINFWAEAVNTAVYLHNRSPTTSLNMKTPYELWFSKKPDVSNLKVFGSVCFIHIPSNLRRKLDPRSRKAVFIGYPLDTKGYKLYDIESKNFVQSKDVVFYENKFHDFKVVTKELIIREDVPEEKLSVDHEQHHDAEDQVPVPTVPDIEDKENLPAVGESYEESFMKQVENLETKRQRKAPKKFSPDECNITESLTAENEKPQSISEALNDANASKWKQALKEEYNSLISNETWELVPPPEGCNVIGSKWVMKIKRDADGNVDRHKARLVAQGYSQTPGIDYEEVFSPVARHSSIRTLLALANKHNEIHQMDVKTAFLNGYIEHDIYMSQPDGFVDQEHPEYVCKLKKSLYGLKQSARCWSQTLNSFLTKNGYRKSNADNCIYVKSINFVILAVYVDDIIPISNDINMLNAEKDLLCKHFEMTDQGEIHFILGMTIKRDRETKTLFISQQKYLESVLDRFATRPDISAAVSILSSYMSNPSKEHWNGVKRLIRYIKGTLNFGLKFTTSENDDENGDELYGYSDANWAGDVDSRRSTSGYVFKVANSTVSWCSKKQASVTKSTTEAEYVALSQATQEVIWIR
ncbi:Retrovirus-related Pol poly from transposon TNT 1-94 [Paramuricea clavata]|uniref:Retrovirus-related Pol poly from transposon TNT 1-94 n=1 Tax=Paramuricea clavata TaxID=317549 RepID=A0A6S7GFZ2_PARCT|nr:Retrovirus-related Pol poly from transposon TNT 1-94 [Paramuricea clavata]